MEVKKIPPLKCPQCKSEKVSPGFSKRKRRAFIPDGKIYCYDCNKITDKKGNVEVLKKEWRSNEFGESVE